jgi:hypothetical protein
LRHIRLAWLLICFLLVSCKQASLFAQAPDAVPLEHAPLFYPPIARLTKIAGDVEVGYRIANDGHTVDVAATSGPDMLRDAAIQQVKSWRFQQRDKAVRQLVTFRFRLNDPDSEGNTESKSNTEVHLEAGIAEVVAIAGSEFRREGCPLLPERVPPVGQSQQDLLKQAGLFYEWKLPETCFGIHLETGTLQIGQKLRRRRFRAKQLAL